MDRLLIHYLPDHSAEIKEMAAIMDAEQPEVETLWGEIDTSLADQFLTTATERGIARWEKMLSISPRATDTLDDRRFRVLAKVNEQLPFTKITLREQLTALCSERGFRFAIKHGEYRVEVRVELTARKMIDEVESLLRRVLPANLLIDLTLLYNQWENVKTRTWGAIKTKTWKALKEEEL